MRGAYPDYAFRLPHGWAEGYGIVLGSGRRRRLCLLALTADVGLNAA